MMLQRMSFWCGLVAVTCVSLAVGCQGGDTVPMEGIEVSGKLLDGGQPATLPNYEEGYNYYEITLTAVGGGSGGSDSVDADGSFTIRGIEPGTYSVAVSKSIYEEEDSGDEWIGGMDPQNSTVTVEAVEGQEITVDLADFQQG
jgi:hypothetical protein